MGVGEGYTLTPFQGMGEPRSCSSKISKIPCPTPANKKRTFSFNSLFLFVLLVQEKMAEADTNTVEKLNKAFVVANSGQDKSETALLMISSSINWADFLTPAPMCIALLGQLMLISTEKDFSLKKQEPLDGFKYMKHPESFRASLVQVSNAGWKAFNEAHKVKILKRKNTP